MTKRLTQKAIEKTPVPKLLRFVWDAVEPGLGIKLTPAGSRIFVYQKQYPGALNRRQAKRTLGTFPAMSLGKARTKAAAWRDLIANGIDPREAEAEEAEKAEAERRAKALQNQSTFASVAERFIDQKTGRRREIDAYEIRRLLSSKLGLRPIHEIVPRDVRKLIEGIAERSPYNAKNAWTHTVGIFKLAVHEEMIEASPCASLDRRLVFKGVKIIHRQRVLNDDEILALWRSTERTDYPIGPFHRLLLFTGVRKSELAGARWSEFHPNLRQLLRKPQPADWAKVDDKIKTWVIPAERFKSDAEHLVPLPDDALAIIETLPRFAGCDLLFTTNGRSPINGFSKAKARLDARMLRALRARTRGDDPETVKLPDWVNHDLRRTMRTGLAALDIPDHVAEMCLGHGRKGLQRTYDQHRYEPQMRSALKNWATRVRSIVEPSPAPSEPSNVVSLREAG